MSLPIRRRRVLLGSALAAAVVSALGVQAWSVDAAPGDADSTLVPIAPCRLLDTRDAPDRVNTFDRLGPGETITVRGRGDAGNCSIPEDATALSMNVTAVGATIETFVTLFPGGDLPLVSSLNPAPGQPPTPNAVVSSLSPAGTFDIFNNRGEVDVIVDVNGYFTSSSLADLDRRAIANQAATDALATDIVALESDVVGLDTGATTTPFHVRMNFGETVEFARNGPLFYAAECTISEAGSRRVTIQVGTDESDDVVVVSDDEEFDGSPALEPGDRADVSNSSTTTDSADVDYFIDGSFILNASGDYLASVGETTALGLNYAGADCMVMGTTTQFSIAPADAAGSLAP